MVNPEGPAKDQMYSTNTKPLKNADTSSTSISSISTKEEYVVSCQKASTDETIDFAALYCADMLFQ